MSKDQSPNVEDLQARIVELERELSEREEDVHRFRNELINANHELERLISQIADELKIAGQIQKVMAPTEYPNINGVEFSTKFIAGARSGGDYFDIFEHQDRFRFGILVASSSGYTMSALFLSVLLKFTGQMEARKGTSASNIVQMIADDLCKEIPSGNRASVFYGVIDRRSFSLNYSHVGNTSVFVQGGTEKKLTPLDPLGPHLTENFKEKVKEETIYLNAKDRLIICTEGLASTTNASGEKFGVERLYKSILSAPPKGVHDLRNEILFQAQSFRGTNTSPNDLTVVVAQIMERVLKLAKGP